MLPNEVFALACRDRYAEDGLVVDESNGEFAHCPLPKGLGETGYYLLHGDHQWQGLLQSRDVGRRCFYTGHAKQWLMKANFVTGYFNLWSIYDEFTSGVHGSRFGSTASEETRRRMSEARKGVPFSEEHKRKIGEARKGVPGKPLSEETKLKMSETRKGVSKSEETKLKMSEAQIGEKNHRSKPIIATKPCGTELRYGAVAEAKRELNTSEIPSSLTTGKIVTQGKFKGWQFRYE